MNKPNDYDNVQAYSEREPLELGGHIMKIVKVEEAVSKNKNPMLMIYLDTDKSDIQPFYYKKLYDSDDRPEKKWGCIVYQLINDPQTGGTNRGLKTFHTCVEESNSGFKVVWGGKYCACFKGKLIGGVFGREQYINSKGKAVFATKCFWLRSVETIKNGVEIPDDRLLSADKLPKDVRVEAAPEDFAEIDGDDDYPF